MVGKLLRKMDCFKSSSRKKVSNERKGAFVKKTACGIILQPQGEHVYLRGLVGRRNYAFLDLKKSRQLHELETAKFGCCPVLHLGLWFRRVAEVDGGSAWRIGASKKPFREKRENTPKKKKNWGERTLDRRGVLILGNVYP